MSFFHKPIIPAKTTHSLFPDIFCLSLYHRSLLEEWPPTFKSHSFETQLKNKNKNQTLHHEVLISKGPKFPLLLKSESPYCWCFWFGTKPFPCAVFKFVLVFNIFLCIYLISKKPISSLKPGTGGALKLEAGSVFLKFLPTLPRPCL